MKYDCVDFAKTKKGNRAKKLFTDMVNDDWTISETLEVLSMKGYRKNQDYTTGLYVLSVDKYKAF